ncbi:hypothetical protein F5880DRAFT_1615566 [Lentinula raphanica]|nr:hypothetical protein F5880DRAFT_1615566 [Lentinula raphanica]
MNSDLVNLEALSTSSQNTQPIQKFRLFTGASHSNIIDLEYFWGLERGELDLWSPLNCISVRADVACLFLNLELALIPNIEVLQKLSDTIEENADSGHVDERRCCFEALPPGEYEYNLVPITNDPPCLFVIGNGSTSPQRLELAPPHYPQVKLNVHPAFAVAHNAYRLYPSVHEDCPYYDPISRIRVMCCERIPQEFCARPTIQFLPSRSGREDDQRSSESDDSEEIIEDDDYSGQDDGIRIQSWLGAVPKSISVVEEVSGKSEGEFSKNAWRNSLVEDV